MSIAYSNLVWQHSQEKSERLIVLLALADYANEDGQCYPTLEMVAKKARIGKDAASKIIKHLASKGYLSRIDGGDGRGNRSTYQLHKEALTTKQKVGPEPTFQQSLKVGSDAEKVGSKRLVLDRLKVGSDAEKVGSDAEKVGSDAVAYRKNHHENHHEPSPEPCAPAREEGEVVLSDTILNLFPHLDSLNRFSQAQLRDCVMLCLRLKVTPDKIPKWQGWLLWKWPKANCSPAKFLETLNQFLLEERNGINNGIAAITTESKPVLSAAERRRREWEAYFLDAESEAAEVA